MPIKQKERSCLHIFIAFILKFLNYLQTFMGVSIIIYSCFMLYHWRHHPHPHPHTPPPASAPSPPFSELFSNNNNNFQDDSIIMLPNDVTPLRLDYLDLASDVAELDRIGHDEFQFIVKSHHLPTPWFIYAFMGVGIALCLITCTGHIAAEAINGCCLCFYTLLKTLFIIFEVGLVAFIALDHQWEKDLPADSTEELDHLRTFIEEHIDICKWVAVAVITIQVLTLLLSIILRALVNQKADLDDESVHDNYSSGRPWEPLLQPHLSQASGSARTDIRGDSDIWSARMRQKYGLEGSSAKENQNV